MRKGLILRPEERDEGIPRPRGSAPRGYVETLTPIRKFLFYRR